MFFIYLFPGLEVEKSTKSPPKEMDFSGRLLPSSKKYASSHNPGFLVESMAKKFERQPTY